MQQLMKSSEIDSMFYAAMRGTVDDKNTFIQMCLYTENIGSHMFLVRELDREEVDQYIDICVKNGATYPYELLLTEMDLLPSQEVFHQMCSNSKGSISTYEHKQSQFEALCRRLH